VFVGDIIKEKRKERERKYSATDHQQTITGPPYCIYAIGNVYSMY
jgi:hypothetical protein